MSEPKLVSPDDPVFPKEVHNLLIAAYAGNITLSGMADNKASILMGASFVVFSISIGDIAEGKASLPLLVLTIFSFIATVFGVLTVRPNKLPRYQGSDPAEKVNILFFGSYTNASREEYINEMIKVLSSEEETYRRLTEDLYDHGKVLRDDKFSWLYWSFTLFLVGMRGHRVRCRAQPHRPLNSRASRPARYHFAVSARPCSVSIAASTALPARRGRDRPSSRDGRNRRRGRASAWPCRGGSAGRAGAEVGSGGA